MALRLFIQKLYLRSLQKILVKILLIFIISLSNVVAGTKDLDLDELLILGAGSSLGAKYKINIFRKIRPHSKKVYLCELEDNELVPFLLREKLIDGFFPIHNLAPEAAHEELKKHIQDSKVHLDAVVTYREEWLQIRNLIAEDYGLSHPPFKATYISQSKYKTKETLRKENIEPFRHEITDIQSLPVAAAHFGFPFFIKPVNGIRSEWARWISSKTDLDKYIENVHKYHNLYTGGFVLEEAIDGHEVDADLVLHKGILLYAGVSDNFPVYKPFALETGHLMPSILDPQMVSAITDHAYKSSLACGYDRGVLHVELMVRPNGKIAILEINGRLGGMYIANWHEHIWGVDLIKAELAISAGKDPLPFLHKKTAKKALAQICVTTNGDKINNINDTLEINEWINFNELGHNKDIYQVNKWVDFPCKKNIIFNGHPNIGEITVKDESPLLAFQKLSRVCEFCPPKIRTNIGTIQTSTKILKKFCIKAPGMERFLVRRATNSDSKDIAKLLPFLTNNVQKNLENEPSEIPNSTIILLVKDMMSHDQRTVGRISLHMWDRMRAHSKAGYFHDLVIDPSYQDVGLGSILIKKIIETADALGVAKGDMACEERLVGLYEKFGFSPVAVYMVRNLPKL